VAAFFWILPKAAAVLSKHQVDLPLLESLKDPVALVPADQQPLLWNRTSLTCVNLFQIEAPEASEDSGLY
jgi:hypothetical protein